MTPDRDLARLRATYADLLDAAATPDLVRFVGDLEALHTAPMPPAPAPLALTRPTCVPRASERAHDAQVPRPSPRAARLDHPPRPAAGRWWWTGFAQAVAAVGTAALILGVLVASALLLPGRHGAVTTGPAATAAASPTLLYPGILGGRAGIIVATVSGQEQLLAEGGYYGVVPSPDGRRFLAYGIAGDAGATAVVDLYAADGRLLRRHALGDIRPLIAYWAPDARHIALYGRSGDAAVWEEGDFRTWFLDEGGARELRLGARTSVGTASGTGAWSAQGRLLLVVVEGDSNGDGRIGQGDAEAVWTVDATGVDARQLYAGDGMPLGWSHTGTAVYVVAPTRAIAVDDRTGTQRVVATAAEVGRQLRPMPQANGTMPTLRTFGALPATALVATPAGDRLALWLAPATAVGATDTLAPYLAIVDEQGRVVGQDRATPGTAPQFTAWAPSTGLLAYSYTAAGGGPGGVRVVTVGGTAAAVPTNLAGIDATQPDGTSLRWSPDGRQLAFLRSGRVTVVAGGSPTEAWTSLGTGSGWPGWQPAPAP